MTENKRRKPYVKPSMEVIKVETTSILAGSDPTRATSTAMAGKKEILKN